MKKCGIGRSETKEMMTGCGKVDIHLMSFMKNLSKNLLRL